MLDADASTTSENGAENGPENGPKNVPESAAPAPADTSAQSSAEAPAKKTAKKAAAKKTAKKAAAKKTAVADGSEDDGSAGEAAPAKKTAKKAAKKTTKKAAAERAAETEGVAEADPQTSGAPMVLFQAPDAAPAPRKRAAKKTAAAAPADDAQADETDGDGAAKPAKKTAKKAAAKKTAKKTAAAEAEPAGEADDAAAEPEDGAETEGTEGEGSPRRRRRRGGRRRRRSGDGESSDGSDQDDETGDDESGDDEGGPTRRRRTRVRQPRNPEDEITSIGGSTRLEAKKQRRREGREAGRRRAPIVSEAEFLARREAVDRVMVIRQRKDLTQIAVIEDKVLVEHYVARESQTSLIGNIYLGRVQNVLPSMEAAFIDIGKGRNAVLYAGEVNWSALGHKDGQPRKVESVLKSGQTVLVQVTKDPVGHKGARLTGQISLPGRFLVYVPDGNTSGISRKLPDTERNRLKTLLKEIVPDTAGVIVRTAAEGASEEELTQDVNRLTARWAEIEKKVAAGRSPELLYGEPDLTLKVVRDLFTEDFSKLVVAGDDAWTLVEGYVKDVAPDLADRLEHYAGEKDVFAEYRIDEQISKGLDRKVWLPSGGSLVIDRTEAMTVVDVNTGKFTGSGGNLEETVTKNNLEAAEEMVRQLRLRDIGGIIVIDFIDMVLESNRDLVLRRLVECLGRDRTRHQVAEVTSLGLVQMTRKRIGTGLLEAFSEDCDHCKGRGVVIHDEPVEPSTKSVGMGGGMGGDEPRGRRNRGGRGRKGSADAAPAAEPAAPSPMALAGSKPHPEDATPVDEPTPVVEPVETPTPVEDTDPVVEPVETPTPVEDTDPVVEPVETPTPVEDTTPVDEPVETPTPVVEPVETQPEAPAPVVVTTTRRRRAAGRPAGPAVATEPESSPDPASAPEPEPDAEVVPPSGDPTEAAEAGEPVVDPEAVAENEPGDEDAAPVFHVPVKKRGTRKR